MMTVRTLKEGVCVKMTVKRRLFLSNILMIVVPAVIACLAAVVCFGLALLMLSDSGLKVEGGEDLREMGHMVSKRFQELVTEHPDTWREQTGELASLIDSRFLRIVVEQDGIQSYSAGAAHASDGGLFQAALSVQGPEVLVSAGERSVYLFRLEEGGASWTLSLFGTHYDHSWEDWKVAAALAALVLLFVVLLTVVMTNRFLTRFVIRKIERPLDLLSEGARRLGEGDLDHRIVYAGRDEFAPVCAAFSEMAARLKASVERARRDEESRKELLAGISHDPRSPLTSIRAYVEGLLDGVARTEDTKRRYLCTIRAKAEDIDRLVSQLFLYSKLDLEGVPVERQSIRLDEFITGFVEEAAPDSRTQGLTLTAEELAPVTVSADPEQLRRVLSNILENSIKYKNKEMGQLRLALEDIGENCRLVLADNGPGVPEEALPKLFDVFYRSNPARKDPAGGSGLGLAIAAKAVQGMGGSIQARNGLDGGLVIEITLPKEEDKDAENSDH